MKIIKDVEQQIKMFAVLMLTGSLILLTAGCEVESDLVQQPVQLPIDSTLNLYCEDVGLFDEKCILDDPENPYAIVNITEENKFELNDDAPSAKSRFYLWATALATNTNGENQYFTALSLHELYAESGSPTIQEQAKKAYRSVLDNHFLSATFFGPFTPEEVFFPVALKDIVAENLYNPTSASLVSLYTDPAIALSDMGKWGYVYDTTNKILSAFK